MKRELVVVRVFADRMEAEVARGALEAAGIEAVVFHDAAGGMYPELSGVRLLVPSIDAERARELLDEVLGA
jgi:hypothetical protein